MSRSKSELSGVRGDEIRGTRGSDNTGKHSGISGCTPDKVELSSDILLFKGTTVEGGDSIVATNFFFFFKLCFDAYDPYAF